MDAGTTAAWVRDRLVEHLPPWTGLEAWVQQAPDWLLVLGAPTVAFLLGLIALKTVHELWDAFVRTGDAVAGRRKPDPATQDGQQAIQRQLTNQGELIRQVLDALHARQAKPVSAEAEEAREAAVADLVEDTSAAAEEAATDLARGDLDQGFAVLEREARAAEATAVDKWRRLGALATGVDTARARAAYEEAFRLAPTDFWTCVLLARLRQQAGDLRSARYAAQAAGKAAAGGRERLVAEGTMGDILAEAGDLAGAKLRYQQSLAIADRLAAADPVGAEAHRDLSVSLSRLGTVLVQAGDLAGAKSRCQAALELAERLAAANPGSAEARRDVSLNFDQLGDVLVRAGELAGAREAYEASFAVRERLAEANPESTQAQRDLSVSFDRLGDILVKAGDLSGAIERYRASYAAFQRLAAADRGSARAQRDLSVSLQKLGDVLVQGGDLAGARGRYGMSHAIVEDLAAADLESAEAQRHVWASLWRLASLEGAGVAWKDVLARMEAMQAAGALFPADGPFLEQARQLAADATEVE